MDIKEKIKSQIKLNNKDIRLDVFITNALFNKHSYYDYKLAIGKNNDFITAPEISQMFGEIIGSYILYIWQTKINSKFNLIELGPGKATLFNDIYNCVKNHPSFLKNCKISLIEINKSLIKIQKKELNKLSLDIDWRKLINFKSKDPAIIYSNEFFDCFPVRQFILKKFWLEKFVSYSIKEKKIFF